eukprot:TRINITY_DN3908_c0_g1_i1.p1 TRINITY_DN3908_c0_g1~~TRINITY_DN3908_c0_g1_i1.p1  ORF type:complete len:415 (-),score=102.01 TRINITY_DN3908_c0_g1_i1:181-1425(-)
MASGKPLPTITDEAQRAIEKAWGLKDNGCSFKCIKHSENHTYVVEEGGSDDSSPSQLRRFILRLTPEDHRSRQSIEAELNFVLLVARSASPHLRLCCPLPIVSTDNNNYIATLQPYEHDTKGDEDNNDSTKSAVHHYYGVLFEHAEGTSAVDEWKGMVDEGIIASWGRSLGEFHETITRVKRSDPETWREKVEKHTPQWHQTHGGGADIPTIEARAEAGHETSKMLLRVWRQRVEPFLRSCDDAFVGGGNKDAVYGVIHGDLNVSNFFVQETAASSSTSTALPKLWLFDFDQVHHNWFGFDLGVVLQGVQFFEDMKWIDASRYRPERFRELFLTHYREANPEMVAAGHTEPEMLRGFEVFREFFHTAIAVDVLFKAQSGAKQFEASITGFCELLVKRFDSKFGDDSSSSEAASS